MADDDGLSKEHGDADLSLPSSLSTESCKDRRLMAKVSKDPRWKLSDALRAKLIKAQGEIVLDKTLKPRDRTRAFSAIVHADKANIESEKEANPVNVNIGVQSEGPVQIYLPDNGRDKTSE